MGLLGAVGFSWGKEGEGGRGGGGGKEENLDSRPHCDPHPFPPAGIHVHKRASPCQFELAPSPIRCLPGSAILSTAAVGPWTVSQGDTDEVRVEVCNVWVVGGVEITMKSNLFT